MLRGVNVGGNPLKMAWLARGVRGHGPCATCGAYLQSGNIVFASSFGAARLAMMLKTEDRRADAAAGAGHYSIGERDGRSRQRQIRLLRRKGIDAAKLHVTFLARRRSGLMPSSSTSSRGLATNISRQSRDVPALPDQLRWRRSLSNAAIEKALGVSARPTCANWQQSVIDAWRDGKRLTD